MIKGYVRYCDRCGVELTKANNTCGFELCDKCNEALEQQLAIKNDLSVPEVTALAEWTAKLTKASEGAYNKGYEAGMKAQEPRKGHWLRRPHVYGVTYCSVCDFELKIDNTNYCPNCGADMRGEE